MGQRLFLTGLALGPALALVIAPTAPSLLPLTLALGGATSAYALLASLRDTTLKVTDHETGKSLLRVEAFRDPTLALPNLPDMREDLRQLLGPENAIADLSKPAHPNQAVAIAMNRVMRLWDHATIDTLTRNEVVELHIFRRLLVSEPDQAGELAQYFQRPDKVLGIRDEVAGIAARRAQYDRQMATFDATWRLWSSASSETGPAGLLLSLQQLETPDPDLWHRVVIEHDPSDTEQRAAALWCVRQRTCDRATVASYLHKLAKGGHLKTAARKGDQLWLDAVFDVVDAWNKDAYAQQDIALSPPDLISEDAARLSDQLDEIARVTGKPRWPNPRGMFVAYNGRSPRPRPNWCLKTGKMSAPPLVPDYVETLEAA